MKSKILILLINLFFSIAGLCQTNSFYYYNGQTKPVIFSNRIIFVHFMSNLNNSEKQNIISNASLDLLNGDYNNISEYVKLKSRVVSGYHWVNPCLQIESRIDKKDTVTKSTNTVLRVCEECPDCTPRWEYYEYNNFDNALFLLSNNSNLRSVSKGFDYSSTANTTVGTEENFFIKIKSTNTINEFSALLNDNNLSIEDVSSTLGIRVYKISSNRQNSKLIIDYANIFYNSGMCEYSTPNFLQIGQITDSNDPRWPDQWNLLNTGQYSGVSGADIRIVPAWQFTKGGNVKVGVLDDGILATHLDLQNNLLPGFNADPNSPNMDGGHGFEVAGILAAIADNNIDITGVAPEAKIIPVKLFRGDESANTIGLASQITRGINWAVDAGAEVLNCSWNLDYQSDMIDNSLTDAGTVGRNGKGCVIVFSSGNKNNSIIKFPSSTHNNVITVGALTHCNSRKSPTSCDPTPYSASYPDFNNWGSNYSSNLSLMAPGVRIPTVKLANYNLANMNGTSASAPMVSGVAALILAINPNLTQQQVRKIIELSTNKVGNYCYNWTPDHPNGSWNLEMGYGRLNAYNATQLARPGVTISNPTYNVYSQVSSVVTGNISIIFNGIACPTSLPLGVSFVRRHEVNSNITFPYTLNPVIICTSNGFNLANPNDGRRWAEAINVTNTSATLRTYVYYGYNSLGQQLGWIPASPTTINFSYTVVGSPTLVNYQLSKTSTDNDTKKFTSNIPFKLELGEAIIPNDIPFEFSNQSITPNPVINSLTINIISKSNRIESILIYNAIGEKVKEISGKQIFKGSNHLLVNVSEIPKGAYILKVGNVSYKFIKS